MLCTRNYLRFSLLHLLYIALPLCIEESKQLWQKFRSVDPVIAKSDRLVVQWSCHNTLCHEHLVGAGHYPLWTRKTFGL